MCGTLRHRGPDDSGGHISDGVGLGVRRLAIIDPAGGHQPFSNEDGEVWAVFNGEIYNYRELRVGLEARGHRFASVTDGEVIVHLWEEYGDQFADRLNGMFAIALHDRRQRRLVLVRDGMGVKPLYYHVGRDTVVFGSEIKAVLASGRVSPTLDLDAVGQFMAWEYVPAPSTLITEISKLRPGELVDVDTETLAVESRVWWRLAHESVNDICEDTYTASQWLEQLDASLESAVKRQLVSDVPLGAFLSGGVDSSLVVAHMGDGVKTFTIDFEDRSYSEAKWAGMVARSLGTSHRAETVRGDVRELFDPLMEFMDDPIGDSSIFPTYLVSRHAAADVKVCLSGDGGDELFGGYETYVAQLVDRTWRRIPPMFRDGILEPLITGLRPRSRKKGAVNRAIRFVEGARRDPELVHARWRLYADEAIRRKLFTEEARREMGTSVGDHVLRLVRDCPEGDEINRYLCVDARSYLPDNCLLKVDRMSMACSLEVRVPFLDPEVVRLAYHIPGRHKVRLGLGKPLLRRLAARYVPSVCAYRPKEGFSAPMKTWLRTDLRNRMLDLLSADRIRREGVFDASMVERLTAEHLAGEANHSHLLWALMVFQDWRLRWEV